jgi:hypothetical protein
VLCAGYNIADGEEAPTSTTHQYFLAPLPGIVEASEHQPSKGWLSPTGLINLGFTTEGNLLMCSSYLPLGVPNWVPTTYHQEFFLAPLPGRKKIYARRVSRFQSFTLLLFCFILFVLASFYQKYKKNEFLL